MDEVPATGAPKRVHMSAKQPRPGPCLAPETHSDPSPAPGVLLRKYLPELAHGVHFGGVAGFLESVNAARTSAYATSNGNRINRLRVVQRKLKRHWAKAYATRTHRSGDLCYGGQ